MNVALNFCNGGRNMGLISVRVATASLRSCKLIFGAFSDPFICRRQASLSPAWTQWGKQKKHLLCSKRHYPAFIWRHHNSYLSLQNYNWTTPIFLRAETFLERNALVDQFGSHTYGDILSASNRLCEKIADLFNAPHDDLEGKSVCFLCENDASYVVTLWAIWISGGVAVPLCKMHPSSEFKYFIQDSKSKLVVCTQEFAEKVDSICHELGIPLLVIDKSDYLAWETEETEEVPGGEGGTRQQKRQNRLNRLHQGNRFKQRPAMILYTSGTTGRPKGVVHTHHSLQAIITDMVVAWDWSPNDVILHVLPLHHMHGIANVLLTPLYIGATCVMMPAFEAREVWYKLLSPCIQGHSRRINLFMTVPTMYAKLIQDHEQRIQRRRGSRKAREFVKAVCSSKIRLMVSGSAALPQPVMSRWEEITGHRLLERYGMTELGMALTNPLHGHRMPGAVGLPFPKVEVCIAKDNVYSPKGYDVIVQGNSRRTRSTEGLENEQGELYVRGPNVFMEYFNKPEATKETFTSDGWFKTGDTACYQNEVYKILGRTSVDIIKSGGYKISALDVERHLLAHDDITDVAVVGLPDVTWGQKVAAILTLRSGRSEMDINEMRNWAKEHMPPYQVPSVIRVVSSMPRNAMGKVNKKQLQEQVFTKELKQTM